LNRKEAYIQFKLTRARNLLNEVPVLLEHQFYDTIINRIYYACFYATQALLTTKDLFPKTHSGIGVQLHQHFVKPGLFDEAKATFFSNLMRERMEYDYGEAFLTDAQFVSARINSAMAYVAYIETLIPALEP
jgi:uncharacterized protein (UPF0332 family)